MNYKLRTKTEWFIGEVETRLQAQTSDNPSTLVAALDQPLLSGSKRNRPAIILLIGSIFNTKQEILLNLAAAIEMMHAATRIHDDLADGTGQKHNHKKMNTRFITSAKVLAGDFAFAAAAQLAAATKHITVMQKFSETLQFLVNGQITYMFNNGDRRNLEAYYDWIHAKTASLFELAAGMAATLGSAGSADINAASQFGYNIGMASQIMDDVADIAGDPGVLGKPAGNDLRQGILTLPTLLYLQAHPEGLDIESMIKDNGNGHGQLESTIRAIRQSEAIGQAVQEASRFLQIGLDALSRLPNSPERDELELLAEQVIDADMPEKISIQINV